MTVRHASARLWALPMVIATIAACSPPAHSAEPSEAEMAVALKVGSGISQAGSPDIVAAYVAHGHDGDDAWAFTPTMVKKVECKTGPSEPGYRCVFEWQARHAGGERKLSGVGEGRFIKLSTGWRLLRSSASDVPVQGRFRLR
jgi:hypothetical protein